MANKEDTLISELIKEDYSIETLIDRLENGNVGSYKVLDDLNKPLIRKDDIIQLRESEEYKKKNFILYHFQNEYFLKRIVKIVIKKEKVEVEDDGEKNYYTILHRTYYLAADKEKMMHIVSEDQIVARAIARQRGKKYYSFLVKHHKPLYNFLKVHFLFFRFKGNKAIDSDMQINYEAIKQAIIATKKNNKSVDFKKKYIRDLKKDLAGFEDPNLYIARYHEEHLGSKN